MASPNREVQGDGTRRTAMGNLTAGPADTGGAERRTRRLGWSGRGVLGDGSINIIPVDSGGGGVGDMLEG